MHSGKKPHLLISSWSWAKTSFQSSELFEAGIFPLGSFPISMIAVLVLSHCAALSPGAMADSCSSPCGKEPVGHWVEESIPHHSQQVLVPEPGSPAHGMEGEYLINCMGDSTSLFGFALPNACGGGKGSCEEPVKRTRRSKNSGAGKCTADRRLQRHGDNNGWTHPRWRELLFIEPSSGSK